MSLRAVALPDVCRRGRTRGSARCCTHSFSSSARTALPELLRILSAGTKEGNESDDTLAMACQTANSLIMREPEMNKHLLSSNLVRSLNDLSQNV